MAEKLAGSDSESPRRLGGIRGTLAAIGVLAAGEAVATTPATEKAAEAQRVDTAAAEVQAEVRNCTLDANRAFLVELAEQVGDELTEEDIDALLADFPTGETAAQTLKWTLGQSPEAKAWVLAQVKENGKPFLAQLVEELKAAKLDGFNDCRFANNEIIIAALDARISVARAAFAEHGETLLFHTKPDGEEIPAAHFVRDEVGKWTLDFAPLDEYREELEEDTDAMEARIRYIWEQLEKGEAIEPEQAAALRPETLAGAVVADAGTEG